ncbi:PD-(D/E)XK nuclease family protein [Streptomyces niveus]|uniref:PD-(D/E)XK nuclease family protein n=1 Tax=Streptomyces niveus TaxID=193462 RepID=UPI00368D922F
MTENWPPDGLVGDSSTITLRLSMFGPEQYLCPASDLLRARGLRPRVRSPWKPEALEPFPNGPFMAAADELERSVDESPPRPPSRGRQRPLHDGVQQWTQHALRMYRRAFPPDLELRLARQPWVYKHHQATGHGQAAEYRITAWGRCLESTDGRRRELRLPVVKHLRARSDAERAIAALVVAEGNPDPRLEKVRVVQFAMFDGITAPVFEGTRDEALALYRSIGAPAVRTLLSTHEYRPGTACASCAVAPVCPALPKAEGLLGLVDRSRPRRSWSSTTGRGHRSCPARGYLRGLRLPTDNSIERGAAVERGRAVQAFLTERHERKTRTPCTPEIPAEWVPEKYRLPDNERRLGAELLRHHAEVCPLLTAEPRSEIRTEPRLVFDDAAADLMVMADPDLLYQNEGSWVWRETKTSASDRPRRDVLTAYPQLALAVQIIGSGALSGPQGRGRVELELLRPGGADLRILDPFAPGTRAAAEAVLREQVSGWHAETLFEAVPGKECAGCEVAQWCSVRQPQKAGAEVGS